MRTATLIGDHDLQDCGVDDPAIRESIIWLVEARIAKKEKEAREWTSSDREAYILRG